MLIGIIFYGSIFAAVTMNLSELDSPDYLIQKIKRMEIIVVFATELERIAVQAVSAESEKRMELDFDFEQKYTKMSVKSGSKPLFPLYSIKTQDEAVAACEHFKDIIPKFIKLIDSFQKRFTNFFDDY